MNMKRIYLLYLLLLLQATAGYAQDSSQNYILTRTMLKSDTKSYLNKVVYYDGIGRPFQTVSKAIENTSKKGVSLATLQEYDTSGRETKAWLPAVITSDYLAPTSFKSSAPSNYSNDSRPYQEAVYETSPQNRIVKQYGAGADWYSGHPVATEFMGNNTTAQLRCTRYKVTSAGALEASGDYANGTLNVTRATDEDGNVSYTFVDKIDRKLLERRINGSEILDTYYVYDSYGNLCYVLPPAINGNISTDTLNLYAYQYSYDGFNRCIRKKLPGTQYIEYVYDNADRLTFSQDGNQRALSTLNWTYYKYDQLNRLTEQGLCTNKVTTSGTTVHIMNYYDSYSFIGTQGFTSSNFSTDTSGYGKGALTGQMVASINGNPIWKAFYYDIRGREVKRVESNAMNGYDVATISYSFTNKPLTLTHVHTSGSKSLTEVYTYSYDYADRLLKVQHKLDSNTIVTLAEYTYDDLGRVKQKKLGGTTHSSTYSYNIRNWLTGITGSKFTQTLTYNNGTAGYNGNITAMGWTANGDSHHYDFAYDGLSRLTSATHGAGRFTEKVTSYDKNGNIKGLQRYGQTGASTYGLIDNLSYTLNGNQLNRVDDAVNTSAYNGGFEFKDGVKQANEYAYDNNGNLTKDLNKGITEIQYNCLNLPNKVMFSDGSTVAYTYAASGTKLRTIYTIGGTTTTMDYCGNVVYENNTAKLLLTEEGYVSLNDNKYHYYLKDHQGNNRIVINQNGNVEETNHYYPFGGIFASTGNIQPYKYNSKELDTNKGLNWYDYGARMYDAALGKFTTMDPMAKKYYGMSPYTYCTNNPILFIDPTGKEGIKYLDENGNKIVESNVVVLVEQKKRIPKGATEKQIAKIEKQNAKIEKRNTARVTDVQNRLNEVYNGSNGKGSYNSAGELVKFKFNVTSLETSDTKGGTTRDITNIARANSLSSSTKNIIGENQIAYAAVVTTRSAGSALGLSNGIFVTETLNAPSVTLAHEIGHTLHLKDTYPANTGGLMDYPPGGLISSEVDEIWRNAYEK